MREVLLDPTLPEANQGLASLDALAAQVWALEPPAREDLRWLLRDECALLLDGLAVRVARGHGALDVTIGEGLAALAVGDRALRLGSSGIGDYAHERLGLKPRTALAMASLFRALRDRPFLREAVVRGDVTPRKAQAVLPVARGEAEAGWVARAREETVRALEAAVRADVCAPTGSGADAGDDEDEGWHRLSAELPPGGREKLDAAFDLAGKILGATAPGWQRLEALCQEYVAAHGYDGIEAHEGGDPTAPVAARLDGAWREAVKAVLEEETRRWEFLCAPAAVAADPSGVEGAAGDPFRLDEELRRVAGLRARWDELLGQLLLLLSLTGVWRDMQFVSFGHYVTERLGMSERAAEQRAWLARRLYELPGLREAMRAGRLSYEKARLVAAHAHDGNLDAWIARAEALPCVALRRELEAEAEAEAERQMCARDELALRVPERVRALLGDACRAARQAAGRWLNVAECLVLVAEHFVATWEPLLRERSTPQRKALARDRGRCLVPGCSRAAAHAHHLVFRSRGGGDELANLGSFCVAHHLHGVHAGYIRVRGRAPDGLTWELGVRRGAPPLLTFPAASGV